jgi:hypothetical protein
LGKYQRCAVEITVFLMFAVIEGSLFDHHIPIKINAPGIQTIDLNNAGHNIRVRWSEMELHVSFCLL